MENFIKQAARELSTKDNVTILCHRSPDGDTLGSGYALHYALHALGKRSRVLCADPAPQLLATFLGQPYNDSLTEDYVVAVDVADPQLLGALTEAYGQRVNLVIDHHPSNTSYGQHSCVVPDASATAQVMTEVIREMGVALTPQIATCLYMGLATDTGCFRYSNTTADSLRTAATLLEAGADCAHLNKAVFETKMPERVAVECHVLQAMEYFFDKRCAIITVSLELIERLGARDEELDGLSALPRQIKGVWVGVTIREQDMGNRCRVSVRTNSEASASAICAAFGGGGHLRAGGCAIQANLAETKRMLVEEIGRQLGMN